MLSSAMPSYTLYLDESGDHGLIPFNPDYPVFVLCGLLVEDATYTRTIVPALDAFKVEHFGTANLQFHYRSFVQSAGAFRKLADREVAWSFEKALAGLIRSLDVTAFCSAIRKAEYLARYGPTRPVDEYLPTDLYLMAFDFLLERVVKCLEERGASQGRLIAEARGRREDRLLEAEYAELLAHGTQFVSGERFRSALAGEMHFEQKRAALAGLELADICAAPTGAKVLKSEALSPIWDSLASKIWVGSGPRDEGNVGLKCFPRDSRLDDLFQSLSK
jgi:hypothetical protein